MVLHGRNNRRFVQAPSADKGRIQNKGMGEIAKEAGDPLCACKQACPRVQSGLEFDERMRRA
jgi:hypothetical protein